ncbi:MAG: amidohydrolase family protein [Flavobacteriales bacterium]
MSVFAQTTFPYNGVRPKEVTSVLFTHANIQVSPSEFIEDGMMLIEKGKIVEVGKSVAQPQNAVVVDLEGKYIFPTFIDLYSDYGMPDSKSEGSRRGRGPQIETDRKGAFGWNQAIRSDQNAAMFFETNGEAAKELRSAGFGYVLTHKKDGIVRGSGALVSLGSDVNEAIKQEKAGAFYSFNKGSSTQDYPSSLMGSIALLRQTYYDAQWYKNGGSSEGVNLALSEMNQLQNLPSFFEAGNKWSVFRADNVGDEFGVQYIIVGTGEEYQRLDDVKNTKATFIIPMNFPTAYDVSDPYLARWVSFSELKHWEMASSNAQFLYNESIPFVFTSSENKEKSSFLESVRKAVESGLPKEVALAALTIKPAQILKTEQSFGQLKKGFAASFFIASKDIFEDDSEIFESWIEGEKFEVKPLPQKEMATGRYDLQWQEKVMSVYLGEGKEFSDKALLVVNNDTLSFKIQSKQELDFVNLVMKPDSAAKSMGTVLFSGWKADKVWRGVLEMGDGSQFDAVLSPLVLKEKEEKKKEKTADKTAPEIFNKTSIIYPFTAYGWIDKPEQKDLIIENVTIWTNEEEGKIENGFVFISKGKIAALGQNFDASKYAGAEIIDGTGMHLTAGIIDEHSHIALASVNEGSQASSAEVEEATVLWPEDINIYRQLSGGVTASQLLHGSANPIGGQSAFIKLRWGSNAEAMLVENADGFIKFALGENVKQSNWGDFNRVRFPQTRMGVEQVYYDHFIRAREYDAEWKKYNQLAKSKKFSGTAPRVDLELKAIAEILNKERFVTCHSYVQSEINMLMHVADSMGFRINTFTHILEGYKVADKMREHGAGGSTFSDWWAYKMEVQHAIPFNGALMHREGIVVAFNSDDAEMARRLNQEAGKAVKYGEVSEEDALKFVTLNPAKLLHVDDRMGSIKVGKDADIVLWTDHPLSIYARASKTFVDGICYFDLEKDEAYREWMEKERARIIQKMLLEKQAGKPTRKPMFKGEKHFHCDTMDESSQGVFYRN